MGAISRALLHYPVSIFALPLFPLSVRFVSPLIQPFVVESRRKWKLVFALIGRRARSLVVDIHVIRLVSFFIFFYSPSL